MSSADDPWHEHLRALGTFIRMQRGLADLSLRQMADRASVSNPYLSQIERGLHEPSVRVLVSIADALGISPALFLEQLGFAARADEARPSVEQAIDDDPDLNPEQRRMLLATYRTFVAAGRAEATPPRAPSGE